MTPSLLLCLPAVAVAFSRLASRTIVAAALLSVATGAQLSDPQPPQPMPGQIVIDPEDSRWLKRHGGAHVWVCGPGDPGDDHTHNPFVDSDPTKGLDERILRQLGLIDEDGPGPYSYTIEDLKERPDDAAGILSPTQENPGIQSYFPPPDIEGGWRTLKDPAEVRRVVGMDLQKLDEAFELVKGSTKNGGLLVVRRGYLVYERYYGLGHREASPNLASCGKSMTSVAIGILMAERPDLFPDGLDQKVFTPDYFPPEAFPLSDPRKRDIKLGQLLTFSAGIRGNPPGHSHGKIIAIDPVGPDGWPAMVDAVALGRQDGANSRGVPYSTSTLWCDPGNGYSYATSSIHLASIMLRHVTGMELQQYLHQRIAQPLGWGRWGYGYKYASEVRHTPGGGGIALRATDMLRFGWLLLCEGRWNDRQLVPVEYVRHCARKSPYNPHYPYSLQFDVNTDGDVPELPRDAFWKSGSGGHALYVVPSLDLVVWKLGGRDGQYSELDTGLPVHSEAARHAQERADWKETVDANTALRKTLRMVIESVVN